MKEKHPIALLLGVALVFTTFYLSGQNVSFTPEKPTPGAEVMVKYVPTGTPLAGMKNLESIAYLLEDELPVAKEIELTWKDNAFVGKVPTSANTKAFLITFQDTEGEKSDNNNDKGYYSKLYTAEGQPVPGARANLSQAYGSYFSIFGIKQDNTKALEYIQKEFEAYPDSKNKGVYLSTYANLGQRNKDDKVKADVKTQIAALSSKKKASEEELMLAYNLSKTIGDKDQAEAISTLIKKKFPKGDFVQQEKINDFYNERDLAKREALFTELKQKYLTEEKDQNTLKSLAQMMASGYGSKDWKKFDYYAAMVDNKLSKASLYNNLAWNLAGGGLEGEAKDIDKAKELSNQSLMFVQEAKGDLSKYKRSYQTEKQFAKGMESTYGMYSDTYALILYRLGNYDEALKYQTIACGDQFDSGDMNERYSVYLEKAKGAAEVMPFLEDKIRHNQATGAMKEQYRRLFLANKSKEDIFDKYMASLEREAQANYKEELREKMLSDEAPNFKLVNLDGKEVNLSDMKGKVVVLDFWATWCGPCKASFPGMQRTLDKFKDRDDVAFLFIDTWENNVDDKRKNAADFIEKNNYTFHVLLDNESKVVADYKVEGIPTKFILDGNGRIRFKSVGFDGNADKLVDEMSIMIELAKSATSGVTTAARP